MAYDTRSLVSSVTDVFGQVISYVYDANSNRTQLSLNAATTATYQYDVLNRLTQLTDAASLNTTFAYDAKTMLFHRPDLSLTVKMIPVRFKLRMMKVFVGCCRIRRRVDGAGKVQMKDMRHVELSVLCPN